MSEDISIFRYTTLPTVTEDDGTFLQQQVSFTLGVRSKSVSGILQLVQTVVKMMLTSPGSDSFATNTGTILGSLFKRGVTQESAQLLKMDIMNSIQNLEQQILDIQAGQPLTDDQLLQEIQILNVQYLPDSNAWQIKIGILSQAGKGVAFDLSPFLTGQ